MQLTGPFLRWHLEWAITRDEATSLSRQKSGILFLIIKVVTLASSPLTPSAVYASIHQKHWVFLWDLWDRGKHCERYADYILAVVFALNKPFCLWPGTLYSVFSYGNKLALYFVYGCLTSTKANKIHNTPLNNLETKCLLNTYFMLLFKKKELRSVIRQIYNKVV